MGNQSLTIFGIRHHGPGCARSLRAALAALTPDIVLVEGPPDAQDALPLLIHPKMRPPVALLIYQPERPQHAAYYPFTIFSPEWQALRYALDSGIPARFIDLPQAIELARAPTVPDAQPDAPLDRENSGTKPTPDAAETNALPEDAGTNPTPGVDRPDESPDTLLREDPIGLLSRAAGYTDRELWWEHQVEQRQDATGLFEGILEAMTALRQHATSPDEREAQREAHMRQAIRAAQKQGYLRIAVVCGAWHAPVLVDPDPAKPDTALLAGLARVPVTATWIPWTNSRLATRSGYGAGIQSPGWYEYLWQAPGRTAIRWVTHAARLLRERDLDASSASVIEAVRLAEAAAALRDLPMPGLAELNEAIQAVLCHGEAAPMALIHERLTVGERLGEVPEETPAVPLQRDLTAQQRSLRLPPSAEIRRLDLDLRKETDRARSHLLHRLQLLGIAWGVPQRAGGAQVSTFHELWTLQWRPECAVRIIEANVWGNTVESAATASVRQTARDAQELPGLTALLDGALLAGLSGAVDYVLGCLGARAAIAADLRHLMDALPPLARVARYGDVRQTRADHVLPVIDGLFERIVAGLPGACASLDDDAASAMVTSIGHVQESLGLLDRPKQRQEWHDAIRDMLDRTGIHGLVRGWACRLLLEARVLDQADLLRLASLALSPVTPAPDSGAWVEGVLRGSGLLLLHQDGLWAALDQWIIDLDSDTFTATLPLLRRAFSGFQPPERAKMGEKIKHLRASASSHAFTVSCAGPDLDHDRAAQVLPVLAQILGVEYHLPSDAHPAPGSN
jgi:hypothetical protein